MSLRASHSLDVSPRPPDGGGSFPSCPNIVGGFSHLLKPCSPPFRAVVSLRAVRAAGTGHSLARRAQRTGVLRGLCVSLQPQPEKLLIGGVTHDEPRRSWAQSSDTAWAVHSLCMCQGHMCLMCELSRVGPSFCFWKVMYPWVV